MRWRRRRSTRSEVTPGSLPEPPRAPISVDEHLAAVLAAIEPLAPIEQPLLDALGLPVAEDLHAPMSLPRFDNSAMDGYAVSFREVAEADERPVHLPVVGEIAAGQTRITHLAEGTAVRIMTGAPIPQRCDAVVPFEWTSESGGEVTISRAPTQGQHIRRAGEDIAEGDLLVTRGEVMGARQVGLLSAVGISHVRTPARPRVVVMSTGTELVEPGRPLGPDSIYDSNSFQLAAAVRAHGAIAFRVSASSDDPGVFADALSDQLVRADLVITSGGVSMGTHDVVKEVLGSLGTVSFPAVAMQPGKPQGFGTVGEERTPIFTLPGNPVSAYVSFQVFVVPALRKLTGSARVERELTPATLTVAIRSQPDRRQFLRGYYEATEAGARVTPVGGHGSHLLGGLAHSNALIVVAEDLTRAEVGDVLPVLVLED